MNIYKLQVYTVFGHKQKRTNKYRAISSNLAHAPACNKVLCPLDVTILKNDGNVSDSLHTHSRDKHCKDGHINVCLPDKFFF